MSTKGHFFGSFIGKGLIIIFVIALVISSMYLIANQSLKNSIKNVEKDRDDSMVILKQSVEVSNQLGDKAQKLVGNSNPNYKDSDALYNDIQNLANKGLELDQDFVENGQKQKIDFQPILSFVLNKNKKSQIAEIKKSLDTEDKNCITSKNSNSNDIYAFMPVIKSTADMAAIIEALGVKDISEALSKATPLQRYTRQDFSFDNESLVKTANPSAYDAIQNSKKLFANVYNYLLAVNSGNNQEANSLWGGLNNQIEVTSASITNAMNEKSPLGEAYYQSEIAGIEQYIAALNNLGITYNQGRETAYYTLQSIEYYNYREKKYPRVSDFNALKQSLSLKYGSSDMLKYSSSDDSSYSIEYLDNGNWIKIEIKGSSN